VYGLLGVWEVLGYCVLIAYDTHEAEWLELRLNGSMYLRRIAIGVCEVEVPALRRPIADDSVVCNN
jgi:hypothetical protein